MYMLKVSQNELYVFGFNQNNINSFPNKKGFSQEFPFSQHKSAFWIQPIPIICHIFCRTYEISYKFRDTYFTSDTTIYYKMHHLLNK